MGEREAQHVLKELAPTGAIRAAINLGNPVLAQRNAQTGELGGVSVELARELGRRLDAAVHLVPFDAAGKVFEAIASRAWDIAFLALDPVRAKEILFTAPYVLIEGTYLVRENSPLRRIEDFDRPGIRIAVGKGAAYDLFLTRALKQAELVRSDTSAAAIELFYKSDLDAAAGVRQPLEDFARTHSGLRVIEGRFTAIEQAMGTLKGRPAAREYLHAFIEEMKRSSFVASALRKTGQTGAGVAPPSATWPTF